MKREEEKHMAFLANYRCAVAGLLGAQALTLELVVSTPFDNPGLTSVNGLGTITQSTNPPLFIKTKISGIIHMLNGPTSVAMTGTSFITGAENFQAVLVLPNGWGKPGSASYRYTRDGQQIDVGPVPAEPIAAEAAA
jgi:hypothetical protein